MKQCQEQLCFAAEAALRMGAGLVKVLSDVQNRSVLQTKLPEILFGERKDLKESLNWCDCILFGPGIGVSEETKEMLEMILEEGTKPLVIDADGLNTISRYDMEINYPYGLILTPHLMEASRLMSCDIMQMKEDLCQNAYELAKKYHCIAVLKMQQLSLHKKVIWCILIKVEMMEWQLEEVEMFLPE